MSNDHIIQYSNIKQSSRIIDLFGNFNIGLAWYIPTRNGCDQLILTMYGVFADGKYLLRINNGA